MVANTGRICVVMNMMDWVDTNEFRGIAQDISLEIDMISLAGSNTKLNNYRLARINESFSLEELKIRPYSGRQVPAYAKSLAILDHIQSKRYSKIYWLSDYYLAYASIQALIVQSGNQFEIEFRNQKDRKPFWRNYSDIKMSDFRNLIILKYMEEKSLEYSEKYENLLVDKSTNFYAFRKERINFEQKAELSIIIAHFNLGKYLGNTLEALKAQTFNLFECIVIDDGSDDINLKIFLELKQYYQDDPRFIFVLKKNEDVGKTRNLGAGFSNSENIMFIDADDLISVDYLSSFFDAFEAGADVVTTHFATFKEGKTVGDALDSQWDSFEPLGPIKESLWYDNFVGGANLGIKKKIFFELGGFDEEPNSSHHDWILLTKASLHNYDVRVIPFPIYFYRYRQDSMLQTRSKTGSEYKIAKVYAQSPEKSIEDLLRTLMSMNVFQGVTDTKQIQFNSEIINVELRIRRILEKSKVLKKVARWILSKYAS